MCGKLFNARAEYVFVTGREAHKKWFCSWHCLRENEKKTAKRGKKPSYLKDEILKLLDEGIKPREIAERLGIRQDMVYYYDRQYGGLL